MTKPWSRRAEGRRRRIRRPELGRRMTGDLLAGAEHAPSPSASAVLTSIAASVMITPRRSIGMISGRRAFPLNSNGPKSRLVAQPLPFSPTPLPSSTKSPFEGLAPWTAVLGRPSPQVAVLSCQRFLSTPTAAVTLVVNLTMDEAHRWPRFTPKTVEAGFRSVQALPMRLRGDSIGALNLFQLDEGRCTTPTWPALRPSPTCHDHHPGPPSPTPFVPMPVVGRA